MNDEPVQPWRRLTTRTLWESRWYDLRQDTVRTHTGATITYTYQDLPGAVVVVPVTPDRQVIMLRQYRYTVGEWCWELPGGGMSAAEEPVACAARELAEETGYVADRLELLGTVFPSNGISNERLHQFLALDVRLVPGALEREPAELMSLHPMPLREAVALVHRNEARDAQAALALLLAAHRLGMTP